MKSNFCIYLKKSFLQHKCDIGVFQILCTILAMIYSFLIIQGIKFTLFLNMCRTLTNKALPTPLYTRKKANDILVEVIFIAKKKCYRIF